MPPQRTKTIQPLGFAGGDEAISNDGQLVAGSFRTQFGFHSFRWRSITGSVDLDGGFDSISNVAAISADGSVIVGTLQLESRGTAFIWDTGNGMRDLNVIMQEEFNLDIGSFILTSATGISANGRVIIGNGNSPNQPREGWMLIIPEPTTVLFFTALIVSLIARRNVTPRRSTN